MLWKRMMIFMVGMLLFSMGIAQAVHVQYLGIHPWEVLHVGLYHKYGLSIGTWSILIGVVLIAVTLILDRRYIRFGTFLNVFCVGWLVDFWLWLDILPHAQGLLFDIVLLFLSMVFMGIGGGMNNAARLGSGPRDGFMLAISDRLSVSIRKVRIVMETSVIVLGILVGGPLFICTFLYTFIQSPLFQMAFLRTGKFLQGSGQIDQAADRAEIS